MVNNKSILTNQEINTSNFVLLDFYNHYLKNIKYFSFGEKNPNKKFYVINRTPGAGLFSNVTYVLNQIKLCKTLGFIPIIDMQNFPTIYNEKKKVEKTYNSWNYFFEPLNKISLNQVYKSKNVFFSSGQFESFMPVDMTERKISSFIKYIRIKKKYSLEAEKFIKKNIFKKDKVLGVHFRGSTYKVARRHAFPSTKEIMLKNVLKLMGEFKYTKVFLVTEEKDYLNYFKTQLGEKCIYTNQYRMTNQDSFKIYPRQFHRFKLGKEILIDTMILSKCAGLTFIKSNVISAAITISKKKMKLHEIFLGYNSRNKFISKWLWFLKYMLPSNFGGLKIIDKKSYLS